MLSRTRTLRSLLILAAMLVFAVAASPASHAAPAAHTAPAHVAHALNCVDNIVADNGTDTNDGGDAVWNEAQVRSDTCGNLRPVAIGEIDECNIFGFCTGPYTLDYSFWQTDTNTEIWHGSCGMPSNDVYYSCAHGYSSGATPNQHCYATIAQVVDGNGHVVNSQDVGYCI